MEKTYLVGVRLLINNNLKFKIYLVFFFVIYFCRLDAQQLTYSTFSNFSNDTQIGGRYILETSGETISGLRKDDNYVFIEGFYATEEYQTNNSDQKEIVTHLSAIVDKIKIFPNPVKDKFYIETELKQLDLKVCIYNIRGVLVKTIFSTLKSSIDVSDLKRGNYLVKSNDVFSNKCIGSSIKLIIIN